MEYEVDRFESFVDVLILKRQNTKNKRLGCSCLPASVLSLIYWMITY